MPHSKLVQELEKELKYLNKWIKEMENGSWSTFNLQEMKERRKEIKSTLWDHGN